MKLVLNREFARRHFAVAALLFGLGCWFGYDGFVAYPKADAEALFAKIHAGAAAPSRAAAERYKEKAVSRQIEFMALALAASLVIALHVLWVARVRFEFDDAGFTANGCRHAWTDVEATTVDRRAWKKKGIVRFKVGNGRIALDAWHHTGVDACEKLLPPEVKN